MVLEILQVLFDPTRELDVIFSNDFYRVPAASTDGCFNPTEKVGTLQIPRQYH